MCESIRKEIDSIKQYITYIVRDSRTIRKFFSWKEDYRSIL